MAANQIRVSQRNPELALGHNKQRLNQRGLPPTRWLLVFILNWPMTFHQWLCELSTAVGVVRVDVEPCSTSKQSIDIEGLSTQQQWFSEEDPPLSFFLCMTSHSFLLQWGNEILHDPE